MYVYMLCRKKVLENTESVKNEKIKEIKPPVIKSKSEPSFLNNNVLWTEVVKRRRPQNCPMGLIT